MSRLEPAAEPAPVFKSLTRVVVPLVCDSSTVWISIAGQRPSHISFGVADSGVGEQWAGREDAGPACRNSHEPGGALIDGDSVVVPINPSVTQGQPAYRGVLRMTFHGLRPTVTHALLGHLLVERAIALVQREQLASKVDNLQRALSSNREIGAAMGILMARHQLTSDQAFDLLRRTSQHLHRKIVAIAAEVIESGELERPCGVELLERRPTPGPPRRPHHLRLAR
ncbi:MAG TPA: ANTAR domain-containing protein [Jatrophihabitans sp.]|nr:ANTAR domain-containing protein [Jatrophihabitans sp.]